MKCSECVNNTVQGHSALWIPRMLVYTQIRCLILPCALFLTFVKKDFSCLFSWVSLATLWNCQIGSHFISLFWFVGNKQKQKMATVTETQTQKSSSALSTLAFKSNFQNGGPHCKSHTDVRTNRTQGGPAESSQLRIKHFQKWSKVSSLKSACRLQS